MAPKTINRSCGKSSWRVQINIYIYIYIAYYKCADISTLFRIGQFLFRIDELLNCKFVNKAEIELTGKSHYIYYIYTYFFCLFSFVFPRTTYIFVFFFAALSLLEECLCRRFFCFSFFFSFWLFAQQTS